MAKDKQIAARREPKASEARAIEAAKIAQEARPVRAQMERDASDPNVLSLSAPHSDDTGNAAMLYETFGSSSDSFVNASVGHLAQLTSRGTEISMSDLNASLALIGAIGPQNELEAALAAQMAATHDLSMMMLRKAKGAGHLDQIKEFGSLATKLQRTFTSQMKALSDWRRGGEQVVRHVHVYEGGQAVVAEQITLGGPNGNRAFKAHEQGACSTAMLGYDSAGHGVPVPGDQREEAVQTPRRPVAKRRRTEGEP